MAIVPLEPTAWPRATTPWREAARRGAGGRLLELPVASSREIAARREGGTRSGRHRHALTKLAFFALTEGPAATMRKARVVLDESRMAAQQTIVLAAIDVAGTRYLGVTRRMGHTLRFDERLVFRDELFRDPLEIELPDHLLRLLEAWIPVPSCPLDDSLPARIRAAIPGLAAVPAGRLAVPSRALDTRASNEERDERAIAERVGALDGPTVWLLGHGSYVRQAVVPWFRSRVAAALDYRAELMRRHVRTPYPVVASPAAILDAIAAEERPLVIVSSYHSDHVPMADAVLSANPSACVFLQKPAGVELSDIERLAALRRRGHWIDVGYNRRHAPLARELVRRARGLPRPLVATMAIKELKIPPSHWYFWRNQGTRITGNLSHWIDLAYHLVDRRPAELALLPSGDTVSLALAFEDGSLVTMVATDRGDDLRGVEEQITVRGGGTTLTIDDFRRACWRSGRSCRRARSLRRDKGQKRMYLDLRRRWLEGRPPSYPADALYWTGHLTWHAARLLRTGGRTHEVRRRDDPLAASLPRHLSTLGPARA